MKTFKKLATLFVAGFMAFTATSTAFTVDAATPASITMGGEAGTTYDAYRVLDAKTNTTTGGVIPVYSVNTNFENFFKSGVYTFSADKGIMENGTVIKDVSDAGLNQDKTEYTQNAKMAALASGVYTFAKTNAVVPTKVKSNETTQLSQGYYLLVENSTTITSDSSKGRVPSKAIMVSVVDGTPTIVNPKEANITISKTADSAAVGESTVGDTINYQINSTIPTYANNFTNIKYNITDTLSAGLTYTGNLNIKAGGEDLVVNGAIVAGKENYFINGTPKFENGVLSIAFNYEALKTKAALGQGVEVTYTAMINEHALIGQANNNKAILDYTNNPNGSTTGIPTETETYTYGMQIKKVDGNTGNDSTVLAGAEFTLTKDGDADFKQVVTSGSDGMIFFKGLGAGTYYLEETKSPAGYGTLDGKIKIVVTPNEGFKTAKFDVFGNEEVVTTVNNGTNAMLDLVIKNFKGINMPATGGTGTTMFMAGGAVLLIAAGALLVVYKKKTKKA